MTYGWKRMEIVGALMNAVFLLALCFYIVLEAIPRFIHPPPVLNTKANASDWPDNETVANATACGDAIVGDWWYLGVAIAMLVINVLSAIAFAGISLVYFSLFRSLLSFLYWCIV
jgi:divalent metal cation (Fe/Co/Zn/Cd) transporter